MTEGEKRTMMKNCICWIRFTFRPSAASMREGLMMKLWIYTRYERDEAQWRLEPFWTEYSHDVQKNLENETIQYPQQHHPDGLCLSAKVVIVYRVEILLEFCVLLDTKWQSRLIEKQTWRKKVASRHRTCSVKVKSILAEVELRVREWEFNWKSIGCETHHWVSIHLLPVCFEQVSHTFTLNLDTSCQCRRIKSSDSFDRSTKVKK